MASPTRREFLELAAGAGLAAALGGCADTLRASLGHAAASTGTATNAGLRQVAKLAALTPTPTAYEVETSSGPQQVFAYVAGGSAVVLSASCTHQGCPVTWTPGPAKFVCPCHGGSYSLDGQVLAGPPPAPLTSYPTQLAAGVVYIKA